MKIPSLCRDSKKLSKIATIILFMGLFRCIMEPIRLHYYSSSSIYSDMLPFLIGALVAALGLLFMVILSYYSKYKMVITMFILTIITMVIVKEIYLIP